MCFRGSLFLGQVKNDPPIYTNQHEQDYLLPIFDTLSGSVGSSPPGSTRPKDARILHTGLPVDRSGPHCFAQKAKYFLRPVIEKEKLRIPGTAVRGWFKSELFMGRLSHVGGG